MEPPSSPPQGGPFMKAAGSPQNYGTSNGVCQIPISDTIQTNDIDIDESSGFSTLAKRDVPSTKSEDLEQALKHLKAENVRLTSELALLHEERELHQRFLQAEKMSVVRLEGEVESLKAALQSSTRRLDEGETNLKQLQECIIHFNDPTGMNGFQGLINLEKFFKNPRDVVQAIAEM